MMQQINLYQPMFRKQKVVFSAATMLQVSVFFLFILSALYAYQNVKLKPYQKQIVTVSKELEALKKQVVALEASANKSKNKLLEIEIEKLTQQLEQREKISNVLSNKTFGNSAGFSSYLEAFARGHVKGTWLTDVKISQGGKVLGLKGKTLSSKLVPVYLQELAKEEQLHGASFNVMELARVELEKGGSEINFLLSTN